jgi:hypothetical protein
MPSGDAQERLPQAASPAGNAQERLPQAASPSDKYFFQKKHLF